MDVGQVVNMGGLISAGFALLAGVALSVELGAAPAKIKKAKTDSAEGQGKNGGKAARGGRARRNNRNGGKNQTSDAHEGEDDADRDFQKDAAETLIIQQDSSADLINNLQRTYVDGLLGPRIKYDVALAILNQYETTTVSEEEAGLMMATQAYLSATRTGSLTDGAAPFGGSAGKAAKSPTGENEQIRRETTEENRKATEENISPPTKTEKPGRPTLGGLFQKKEQVEKETKKTIEEPPPPPSSRRSTTRNTRRKTRPE
ncbi:MAG: hypothetical protein SGJ27_15645 [Candidatus Melainabacteria bacterium]|nr:hypothetical protein [Candidatus Melainabacteria bacterium]